MVMPRPRGEALKIAKAAIPGLKNALKGESFPKSHGSRIGVVEEKVVSDNEKMTKDFRKTYEKKKTRVRRKA